MYIVGLMLNLNTNFIWHIAHLSIRAINLNCTICTNQTQKKWEREKSTLYATLHLQLQHHIDWLTDDHMAPNWQRLWQDQPQATKIEWVSERGTSE